MTAPSWDPAAPSAGARELAVLLSIASRIEPELIRAVRLALAPTHDVGAEADFWFSDWVGTRGVSSVMIRSDLVHDLRAQLGARLLADERDAGWRVWSVIERVHARISPALLLEERLAYVSVLVAAGAATGADLDEELRPALRALVDEGRAGVGEWFAGAWTRLSDQVRQTATAWQISQVVEAGTGRLATDSRLELRHVAEIVHRLTDRQISVERDASGLAIDATGRRGLRIDVPATEPYLLELTGGDGVARLVEIPHGDVVSVDVDPAEPVNVRTGRGLVYRVPALRVPSSGGTTTMASATPREEAVTLRHAPEDLVWAEWVEFVLAVAGVIVRHPDEPRAPDDTVVPRPMLIASTATNDTALSAEPGEERGPLVIYVADRRPLRDVPISSSAFIAGLSEADATSRILELVGRPDAVLRPDDPGPRFPGDEPAVFRAPTRNGRFTGREADLLAMRAQLRFGALAAAGPAAVALTGMGGIGKTQIALEYAHRFRTAYDVVWWVDADPVTFVDISLIELGARLGLRSLGSVPEDTRATLTALGRGEPYRRWLVVFDHAEDPRVEQFIPPGTGHVILTSHDIPWTDRTSGLPVDVFDRMESIQHLAKRVPTLSVPDADRLADALGDLPIAVAAAGAWLDDTGMPVTEYVNEIERQRPEDMTVVEASFDRSLQRLQEQSPAAHRLLQLCSVMAPQVSLDLLNSDEVAQALLPIDPALSERMTRAALIQRIHRLALLRVDAGEQRGESTGGGQVILNRLLQLVVRSRMTDEELAQARHQVHRILAGRRPPGEVDDPATWQRYRLLWPHLEASDSIRCQDESVRALVIDRVRYLWLRGDLQRALQRAESVETEWVSTLDGSDADAADQTTLRKDVLRLRTERGNILRTLYRFAESYEVAVQTVAGQRALLGPDHPHTLLTAGGVAADLRGLGRYREALEFDQETHAVWLERYGADHPRTLAAGNNLAASWRLVGDFRAALAMDEDVYRRRRSVLGDTHPATLWSAGNLGRDLRDAGEYARSVTLLRTTLETTRQTLPADSRQALHAQVNLAISLLAAGAVDEAGQLVETAHVRLRANVGPNSPDTRAARLSWSLCLAGTEDLSGAARELGAVLREYEQTLGAHHPHSLACASNVSAVALATGDIAVALELAQAASAGLAEVLGQDHPHALIAGMNLAIAFARSGQIDDAHRMIQFVSERASRTWGPDHPQTLCCLANAMLILDELDLTGPEITDSAVYDRLTRRIGNTHPTAVRLASRQLVEGMIDPHPF